MDPLFERHHMTEKPDITALVTARMCHDLASPLGAVGNGVELVEMAGQTLGQEGELVKASVNAAAAKLKLFRIAYGQFHSEEILMLLKSQLCKRLGISQAAFKWISLFRKFWKRI